MHFNLVVSVLTNHFIISLNSNGCERQGQKESVWEGRGRRKLVTPSSPILVHFSFVTCGHICFLDNSDHWITAQIKPDHLVRKSLLSHIHFCQWRLKKTTSWVAQTLAFQVKWQPFMSLVDFPSSLHPLTWTAVVAIQCQLFLLSTLLSLTRRDSSYPFPLFSLNNTKFLIKYVLSPQERSLLCHCFVIVL